MGELLLVGRVARAHGNRGQVIVNLETDFAGERYRTGAVLWVGAEGDQRPLRIERVRFHRGRPVIALEGVETMNDAETLAGAGLWMPREALGTLPERTYYRHDLVGCDIVDADGTRIGTVREVEGTVHRSHLVVDSRDGEIMIPLVDEFCREVDLAARRIRVTIPDELRDLNK